MYPEQNNTASSDRLSFDEKPIGNGQKMTELSEYPPDFNVENLETGTKPTPLPLNKRVQSKVWKTRKQAFQELFLEVSQNPSIFEEYLKDAHKFITDSTPIVQEKALKVFLKYLESTKQGLEDPKTILKALIEKCLVVEKGQTANLATEVMFWVMDNYPQVLINQLNENMLNKNPKICASVLTFLQKLLNNYGAKKLKQFEEFGKNFTLLSNIVRPVAKQQTVNLFKQMYKWMGDIALAFNMHPQVKEEVIKFTKTYTKEPMIIKRGLNEDQKKSKKPITESIDDDQNDQPQDVLAIYDSRWVDKVLEEPKWKDKKGLLDEFIKKTKVKNIASRDSSHFITLIKRLLADNNINLLQCGFKVIKNLSRGLKKNFTHVCKVVLDLVFSKLRDTKAMIVDQAQETLQSMMNCLLIDQMLQDIRDGLKDKAPNMRLQTLKFVQKMVSKRDKKMAVCFKNLTALIIDLNQDGASEVRDKALDVLCKLKSSYGINFFGDKLKKIQGKKLQTIENYVDPNQSKIDEEPIVQPYETINEKKTQKNTSVTNSQQTNYPNNSKHTIISQPAPKISQVISDFDSSSENIRLIAYQNLFQKSAQTIYQQLVEGFKNKLPMARETNPTILKVILNCIKKCVHNQVGIEHMDVLLYHDWKKCKPLLIEFIQSAKLNLQALQCVKNAGILAQPPSNKRSMTTERDHPSTTGIPGQNIIQSNPLKNFYNSVQGFIPRMSSPESGIRLQAVQSAMEMLKTIPINAPNQSNNEPTATVSQAISQFFNVLKYRIQDSNEEIANNYITLVTEMLSKGFFTKYRTPGRLLISSLLPKITNPRLSSMQAFIQEMVINHSLTLWQYLPIQLVKENMCASVLSIIRHYNESFFKNADQKSYILPLLTNISKDIEVQKCSQLLDQIVQINGEQALQKIVKQSKIGGFNIQTYLQKWKIHINTPAPKPNSNNMFNNVTLGHSKIQRLAAELDNPWPLTLSPLHIFKMIGQMMSLGEPFQTLATPTLLTQHQTGILNNLRPDLVEDYSDIWTKWIFWRMHIETQPKNLQTIFNMIYKMISIHNFQLHQSQIVTILSALISCLVLHKSLYLKQITRINTLLNQHPFYKAKTFRFWINSFNDPTAPVDQILNLIVNSCADMIPSEMVTLARYPAVVKNKQFNQYLRANYTEKLLTVYGFNLQATNSTQQKTTLSQTLKLDLLTEVQSRYFVQTFERCSSNQLIDKIVEETKGIPEQFLMQTHLKIMHSIIMPYLHRELSFINVYNYFKHLQKIMTSAITSSCLLNTVRTLSFFLIDLDMTKLENNAEMMKTINKLLLILLEISEPKHILQVLFVILKHQIKINGNVKLILLLPKCITKVIKNPIFKSQYQRSQSINDCLHYVTKQFIQILSIFEFGSESSLMRAIKNLLNEMITTFPVTATILQNLLNENVSNIPEQSIQVIKELLQDKTKENSHNLQNINVKSQNSENSFVQSKDIKSTTQFMKSIRPGEMMISSHKKNIDKMTE